MPSPFAGVVSTLKKAETEVKNAPAKVVALAKREEGKAVSAVTTGVSQGIGAQIAKIPKPIWWFGGAVALAIMFRRDLEKWYGKAKSRV